PLGGGTVAVFTQYIPAGFDWRILFQVGGRVPLALSLILLVAMRETRHAADDQERVGVWKALFGEGRAAPSLLLWLTFLPTVMILYLILYWLPTLVVAKGLDKSLAPQAAIAFNYASVIGALVFGRIVDRIGPRGPMVIAYLALIGTVIALAMSTGLFAIVV